VVLEGLWINRDTASGNDPHRRPNRIYSSNGDNMPNLDRGGVASPDLMTPGQGTEQKWNPCHARRHAAALLLEPQG
jgi:hypothetical protein